MPKLDHEENSLEIVYEKPHISKPRIRIPFVPDYVREKFEECKKECYNDFLTEKETEQYCGIYAWQTVTGFLPTNKHLELLGVKPLTKENREHLEKLGYIKCEVHRGMYYCKLKKPMDEVCMIKRK